MATESRLPDSAEAAEQLRKALDDSQEQTEHQRKQAEEMQARAERQRKQPRLLCLVTDALDRRERRRARR